MSAPLTASACPRCGTLADHFIAIDAGLRETIAAAGNAGGAVPDKVCASCFDILTGSVSQGLKLRMERDVREKNKMMMWKNRVHLIKNASGLMSQKAYSEAAVQYEKYLRVLEVVYNLKKGELSPSVFNNSSRSKELTVVASVYWDLLRIYDTHPRYADHMTKSAGKLAQFLPFSPIYPDIVKKAESFSRSAKNPNTVRQFLRMCKSSKGGCFVATAVYADKPDAVELTILRQFRDQKLRTTVLGRQMIWAYYKTSPHLVKWVGQSQLNSRLAQRTLTKIAFYLKKNLHSL